MQLSDIHVIILAAGLSTRMGKDNKLLLPYKKHTIVEETITQIISTGFSNISVVIGHDELRLREVLENNDTIVEDIDIVANADYASGQVSSLKRGLSTLTNRTAAFMVALGDMPLISMMDYRAFAERFINIAQSESVILRPKNQLGNIGHPVLFSSELRDDLLNNKDKESSKPIIMKNRQYLSFYKTEKVCFYSDIDTKEDYEKVISPGV